MDPAPEAFGDWDDGVVTQATDLGDSVVEGAGDTACLAHLCGNEEFQDTWDDVGDTAFNADQAVWDGENSGPETSEVIFGFGGDDPELAPDPDAAPDEVNDWWEGLDPDEERSIVSRGNPDTADNVSTMVPGTGHSDYFDDPQASQMEYMGEVIAGER